MKKVPFIYRNNIRKIMESYEPVKSTYKEITNFDEYLNYRRIGTEDGWLLTSDGEYQALRWLENNIQEVRSMIHKCIR